MITRRRRRPEQRDAARTLRAELKATLEASEQAMKARRDAILLADAEYQRLKSEYGRARADYDAAPSPHYFRYCGGTSSSLFFSVAGNGDTLAELVDDVIERKTGSAPPEIRPPKSGDPIGRATKVQR